MQTSCHARPAPTAHESNRPLSDIRAVLHTTDDVAGDETVEYQLEQPPMLDRFQLLEKIGEGAFGTVWKAHDKALERIVAIKVPRHGPTDARAAKRFLREARMASQLKHPGIVSVYEVGRHAKSVYIVSDYIANRTLADWIEHRRPSSREVAGLCQKIAEAVHHAHESGVIHRDLKPSNILVDESGEPHVTDFGSARRTSEPITMTAEGQVSGTPAYMSPEQLQGDSRRVDHRTDVYALGVILYELLTGERPFRPSVHMRVSQVVQTEAPSPRKFDAKVPRDLANICVKCLEQDPCRRYRSARGLAQDLRRHLDSEPVTARPISPPIHAWRWCQRNQWAASLVTALSFVLIGGLATTTHHWLRAEPTAVREVDTQREIETLAQQFSELAERLRRLEKAQPIVDWSVLRYGTRRTEMKPGSLRNHAANAG